ncbi:MAG: hypothetical protein KAT65_17380 [Methanophagales archaeon]|nr:hypothetical protein [Methanophagales archaeon]
MRKRMEEVGKAERMKGMKIKEIGGSSRGMYIRNIADIIQKWNDIRSTADITKLYEIALQSSGGNLGWKK